MSSAYRATIGTFFAVVVTMLGPNVAYSDNAKSGHIRFCSVDGTEITDSHDIQVQFWTFFVVHGFHDTATSAASLRQAVALQHRYPEANVVLVDWCPPSVSTDSEATSSLSTQLPLMRSAFDLLRDYKAAVTHTRTVGRKMAEWISGHGISPARVGIFGHSLGAQIAAYASNECAQRVSEAMPVHTIIGADPAGPGFERSPAEERLDASDARYVLIVHTTEMLGDENPIGTWDIYIDWPESVRPDPVKRHSLSRELVTECLFPIESSASDSDGAVAECLRLATVRIEGPALVPSENLLLGPLDMLQAQIRFNPHRSPSFIERIDQAPILTARSSQPSD